MKCNCTNVSHVPKFVVLTGGPGAGKTAVLEVVRRRFCEHVMVLPEAATIIYGGGFPRGGSEAATRAAQRSIYHVQRELERMATEEKNFGLVVCDRGTVDGAAYWPGSPESYWLDLNTTQEEELRRYHVIIHLSTPSEGYNHQNPLRIETAQEAQIIDKKIVAAWKTHPRLITVENNLDFLTKAAAAIALISAEVPTCCALNLSK
jgi:predicted ATPase